MHKFGYKSIEEDSIRRLKKSKAAESLKAVRRVRLDLLLVKLCWLFQITCLHVPRNGFQEATHLNTEIWVASQMGKVTWVGFGWAQLKKLLISGDYSAALSHTKDSAM